MQRHARANLKIIIDHTQQQLRATTTDNKVFRSVRAIGRIDIYEIRDGKIAVNDSYWKQVG